MAERTGPSTGSIADRQAALSARESVAVDADRMLAATVRDAHAAAVTARRRLDAIAADIDGCVQRRAALALDTPLGAREFQKFLITRQRDLITIVEEVHRDGAAKQALLQSLRRHYSG